jgi:hypothetical protein
MSLTERMRHGQMSPTMGKILPMKTWIMLFTLLFAAGANAHNYKYSDLIIRDYDEMSSQVQIRIKNAHKANKDGEDSSGDREAIEQLRDALKLIYSRPNTDNMASKLTPDVRRELNGYNAFEDTVSSLVAEAQANVKDEHATVAQRSTSFFILENILKEIRPEVAGNEDLQRVVKRVAEAGIKIPDDVIKDRKTRSMFNTKSPTELAKEILKALPKKDEKK